MGYCTTGDIDNFSSGNTSAENNAIIDSAEQKVEKATNDYFYPKTFHKFLSGKGTKQIYPFLLPGILSVNEISINETEVSKTEISGLNSSGTSGSATVNLTQSGIAEDFYKNDYLGIHDSSETTDYLWGSRILSNMATSSGITSYTLENALPMTTTSGDEISLITNWGYDKNTIFGQTFSKGDRNIEIKGSYGHYSCPANISEATIILVRQYNNPTLYTRTGYGVKEERLGDYSLKRDSRKSLTGIQECDEILTKYVRRKPLLGAV